MNDLKKKLANLTYEYSEKNIPDLKELFHEDPTTKDLEELLRKELTVEQREFYYYSEFSDIELKRAAKVLKMYYYCSEQTLDRMLYYVNKKNQKSKNLIKVLIWKKNIAAIRHYIINNIISEIDQIGWDLTPYMINILFEDVPAFYSGS